MNYLELRKFWYNKIIYGNELKHHGIKGQKWGVRNGPPYPLTSLKKNFLDYNLQLFAKKKPNNSGFKYKNKKEAAIVRHVFDSISDKETKEKPDIAWDINIDDQGAYTYYAKNVDGHGTFVPYARKRISQSSTKLYKRNEYEK